MWPLLRDDTGVTTLVFVLWKPLEVAFESYCSRHSRAAPTWLTHTHSFIHAFEITHPNTPIQYTDGGEHWPKVQRFREKKVKKGASDTRVPVQPPITLPAEKTDRRGVIDHFAFFSWLESQSRPS